MEAKDSESDSLKLCTPRVTWEVFVHAPGYTFPNLKKHLHVKWLNQ